MARNGKLLLKIADVFGKRIDQEVNINLHHMGLTHRFPDRVPGSKTIRVVDLHGPPQNLYRLQIDPPSYQPVQRFVRTASKPKLLEIRCPVDSGKVRRVKFPSFASLPAALRGVLKDRKVYDSLGEIPKAGLLNILTKSLFTPLLDESLVVSHIVRVNRINGDRIIASVDAALWAQVNDAARAELFERVDASLHPAPEAGFKRIGSFKTPDDYGNLQITFFNKDNEFLADIDIDDAAGLGHVFQVLRNRLSGRDTHPYDIHQILYAHQSIDAGYRFEV